MKVYMRKVGKTLVFGLVILAIAGMIYMVVPKYQIQSVRVDDDYVVVTRVNTITGQINTDTELVRRSVFDKYFTDKK